MLHLIPTDSSHQPEVRTDAKSGISTVIVQSVGGEVYEIELSYYVAHRLGAKLLAR